MLLTPKTTVSTGSLTPAAAVPKFVKTDALVQALTEVSQEILGSRPSSSSSSTVTATPLTRQELAETLQSVADKLSPPPVGATTTAPFPAPAPTAPAAAPLPTTTPLPKPSNWGLGVTLVTMAGGVAHAAGKLMPYVPPAVTEQVGQGFAYLKQVAITHPKSPLNLLPEGSFESLTTDANVSFAMNRAKEMVSAGLQSSMDYLQSSHAAVLQDGSNAALVLGSATLGGYTVYHGVKSVLNGGQKIYNGEIRSGLNQTVGGVIKTALGGALLVTAYAAGHELFGQVRARVGEIGDERLSNQTASSLELSELRSNVSRLEGENQQLSGQNAEMLSENERLAARIKCFEERTFYTTTPC